MSSYGYANIDEAKWNRILTYWLEQAASMGDRGFYFEDGSEEVDEEWQGFLKEAIDNIKGELV